MLDIIQPKKHHTLERRILDNSIPVTESGCWIWLGSQVEGGYCQMRVNGEKQYCHRVSYETFKGEIRKSTEVMHSCDEPSCVNPDHLSLGTHQENTDDKVRKGRHSHGETSGRSILNEYQVKAIRVIGSGMTKENLATIFNVSRRNINAILINETWKHIRGG